MKKYIRWLAAPVIALFLVAMVVSPALAQTATTDKESYKAGETAKVAINNQGFKDFSGPTEVWLVHENPSLLTGALSSPVYTSDEFALKRGEKVEIPVTIPAGVEKGKYRFCIQGCVGTTYSPVFEVKT